MKNLAFLFVFAAIVACNTQQSEECVDTTHAPEPEVTEVEAVTDSTLILNEETVEVKEEDPVTE